MSSWFPSHVLQPNLHAISDTNEIEAVEIETQLKSDTSACHNKSKFAVGGTAANQVILTRFQQRPPQLQQRPQIVKGQT